MLRCRPPRRKSGWLLSDNYISAPVASAADVTEDYPEQARTEKAGPKGPAHP